MLNTVAIYQMFRVSSCLILFWKLPLGLPEEYSNFEKVDRLRALAQAKLALASRQQKEFESSSFIEPIY